MGALLAIVLSAGFPPSDDGGACESWTATRAVELAAKPQPAAAQLGLSDVPGLADLDERIWTSFAPAVPRYTSEDAERVAAALDGRAPISTVPELVEAARRLEAELGKLLVAARGSRNRLPESLQLWSVLDQEAPSPTILDLHAGVRLSVARGRDALGRRDLPRAVEACVGLLGLVRASAGTSLFGRMVSASWGRRTRDYCLQTARRSNSRQREEIQLASTRLRDGWPSFAKTLEQELVFGQVAFFSKYWSADNRAKLPQEALHLSQTGARQKAEGSWWRSLRHSLFGRWSAREQCLLYARALPLVDSAPQTADPALRNMDEPPPIGRLAGLDELPAPFDHWVGLFRRVRGLETDLALLGAGLAVWRFHDENDSWPASLGVIGDFSDSRTGRALFLEARGDSISVVAPGDSAHAAPEIRIQLTEPH